MQVAVAAPVDVVVNVRAAHADEEDASVNASRSGRLAPFELWAILVEVAPDG